MRKTVSQIIKLNCEVFGMGNVFEVKGNANFIDVLNTYTAYVNGKQNFLKNPPEKIDNRGRKSTVDYSDDVCFLAYLVENLYKSNNKKFSNKERESTKRVISNGVSGETDFFDPVRSKMWIDLFSALDKSLHIFTQSKNAKFSDFFLSYITLYNKLNNKKIVPFYPRWIKEISAMYTIYLNETYDEFEKIANQLQNALDEGIKSKIKKRVVSYETDYVRNYLMTNIFMAHSKNKDNVIKELSSYIKENPDEFFYEKGKLSKRFRRYYCIIKDMLNWIKEQSNFVFDNEELIKIFCDNNVSYEDKDNNVHKLEGYLAKKIIELSELKNVDDATYLSVLISEPEIFEGYYKYDNEESIEYSKQYQLAFSRDTLLDDKTYDSEIVFEVYNEDDRTPDDIKKRGHEMVVDGVVKLLRFIVMIINISKATSTSLNEFERPSRSTVIGNINETLKKYGVLSLPTHSVNSYNDKSLMDFCAIKYIDGLFNDED